MLVKKFDIEGPLVIENIRHGDERGFFTERYRDDFMKSIGITAEFCQENYSRSAAGVLRGLHYQYDKPQAKLVTCTRGEIFDVIVDIRKGSPTFGKSVSVVLSGNEPKWFWVPYGFAHGFYVISSEGADLMYKVDNYYNPKGEDGILWNDPALAIQWPFAADSTSPLVSERDKNLKLLSGIDGL